jgi:hypothetical protein
MKEDRLTDEDIISKVAEHYSMSIQSVASIHKLALKQLTRHSSTVYTMNKQAQAMIPQGSTLVTQQDAEVINLANGQKSTLRIETPVVMVSNGADPTFEIVDGVDAGAKFKLANQIDLNDLFAWNENVEEKIQDAAEETGLNEPVPAATSETTDDFAITEV